MTDTADTYYNISYINTVKHCIRLMKSANLGVVQVLPVNSTEVSDWGTYDTSTIEKEVMIPVTVIFTLK